MLLGSEENRDILLNIGARAHKTLLFNHSNYIRCTTMTKLSCRNLLNADFLDSYNLYVSTVNCSFVGTFKLLGYLLSAPGLNIYHLSRVGFAPPKLSK